MPECPQIQRSTPCQCLPTSSPFRIPVLPVPSIQEQSTCPLCFSFMVRKLEKKQLLNGFSWPLIANGFSWPWTLLCTKNFTDRKKEQTIQVQQSTVQYILYYHCRRGCSRTGICFRLVVCTRGDRLELRCPINARSHTDERGSRDPWNL